jgi:hypothetical protein
VAEVLHDGVLNSPSFCRAILVASRYFVTVECATAWRPGIAASDLRICRFCHFSKKTDLNFASAISTRLLFRPIILEMSCRIWPVIGNDRAPYCRRLIEMLMF